MLERFILPGISLGLSATSIPGPLQAFLIQTTLRYRVRRSMLIAISPLVSDPPIIILIVFLLGQMPPLAIQIIRLLGGLVLLWIAWIAWQQYRAGAAVGDTKDMDDVPDPAAGTPGRILLSAVLVNVLSPGPYLFWATVNGPLLLDALEQSVWHGVGFLVAFYGTFAGGLTLLAIEFDRLGQINRRVTRAILLLTIGLLLFYGTALIGDAFDLAALHRVLFALALGVVLLWRLIVWLPRRGKRKEPLPGD